MKVKEVYLLKDALLDLNEGRAFYDQQERGVGDYFWSCLLADIESLIIYAGIHSKKLGLFQMFSRRFPYAIYYEVINNLAYVAAILPMRKNPAWILRQLKTRR